MRYQVPQFIDVEDKIIGPFTIKQFVYIAGGLGMSFVVYRFLNIYIAAIFIAVIIGLSLALAFYKINNKPFIDFLESAFMFYTKQNLYIWKKQEKKILKTENDPSNQNRQVFVPKLSESKLKDLSWSLDVNENINPVTSEKGINTK